MNVNRDLKLIWWAPERCATKITAEIFKKLGFEVYNSKKNTFTPLTEIYHSHDISFPSEFSDYSLISNIRNPYDRVISYYLNFTSVGQNFVFFKNQKDELKKRIETFCLELFEYSLKQRILHNTERKVPLRDYVTKLNFDYKVPDKFIRMENLKEDMSNLDFINQSNIWKSGEIEEMLEKNEFINERPFKFYDLYNIHSAYRVYDYHKKHFFICDYDPFSFSEEILTEEQKFNFVHGIL